MKLKLISAKNKLLEDQSVFHTNLRSVRRVRDPISSEHICQYRVKGGDVLPFTFYTETDNALYRQRNTQITYKYE